MKIGIFFGGPGREREISFAGGRTVYDNLDKSLFTPIPFFVDSRLQLIRLEWRYLYKGTIRDFYPPLSAMAEMSSSFQHYVESLTGQSGTDWKALAEAVGTPVAWEELPHWIDMAFLALHGRFGEDGQIQGILESMQVPYTGSGILPSAVGMNKAVQKRWMQQMGWPTPTFFTIDRAAWLSPGGVDWYAKALQEIGPSVVVRPAHQGSSIGVSILHEPTHEQFISAVERAFFIHTVTKEAWEQQSPKAFIRQLTDIREGVGLPLRWNNRDFYLADDIMEALKKHFAQSDAPAVLYAHDHESQVVVEAFVEGKEFSCIVIRNETADGQRGQATALPPTEIVKGREVFDYRSKYLAGLSRKITPIELPDEAILAICEACERLFEDFGFQVYARIDGFYQEDGTIYLNDPNTTSGMLPSSFFFHQAAAIGLNPSQFLTYILRCSLLETIHRTPYITRAQELLARLDEAITQQQSAAAEKTKVAVVLGGFSAERHISVESGRNIYEKLAASADYAPIPFFVKGSTSDYELYQIPIHLLLKDNADDIADKIGKPQHHPVVEAIKNTCQAITGKYATAGYTFEPQHQPIASLPNLVDFVFIALHGRPGEDGDLQQKLEAAGLPYNGSGPQAAALTIDKYATHQVLRTHGFSLASQYLLEKADFEKNPGAAMSAAEAVLSYPLIAKPVDDGCSAAVKKIESREALQAFLETLFRTEAAIGQSQAEVLGLKRREEFPRKEVALLESLITKGEAIHFLEITGGMLIRGDKTPVFEVFEPSEALAGNAVLSLEEKFLAGEGQNLTPARLAPKGMSYDEIARQVKSELARAARLLGVRGYCRIDAFVRVFADGRAETIIIEVNSLPGMTPATVIFHQAALNGYAPLALIDRIIQFGFERKKEEFSGL